MMFHSCTNIYLHIQLLFKLKVLTLVDHFCWFFYFTSKYHSILEIASFFTLIVWIVPFMFFLSLSANEFTLPSVGSTQIFYIFSLYFVIIFYLDPVLDMRRSMSGNSLSGLPKLNIEQNSKLFKRNTVSLFRKLFGNMYKREDILPTQSPTRTT